MGIKDLNEYLRELGIEPTSLTLPVGSIVMIDSMIMVYAYHDIVIKTLTTDKETKLSAQKRAMAENLTNLPWSDIYVDGQLQMDCMRVDDPGAINVALREGIVTKIAGKLLNYLLAGITPVLVWDHTIVGLPRTPGKIQRGGEPMILRNVDQVFIFETLKAIGFPTVLGWTEGEKVACSAVRGGVGHAVISRDTDCIGLGVPIFATSAELQRNNGVILRGVVTFEMVREALAKSTGRHSSEVSTDEVFLRLLDAALFLGCDFNERKRGNRPNKLAKRTMNMAIGSYSKEIPGEGLATREFFTISEADMARGAALTREAIDNAWRPNEEYLSSVKVPTGINVILHVVRNGPAKPRSGAAEPETSMPCEILEYGPDE